LSRILGIAPLHHYRRSVFEHLDAEARLVLDQVVLVHLPLLIAALAVARVHHNSIFDTELASASGVVQALFISPHFVHFTQHPILKQMVKKQQKLHKTLKEPYK
jgi:hypothetical protein